MLEINLLPVREVRRRAAARQMAVQLVLVLLLVLCAIVAVDLRLRGQMDRSQARIRQMERDIALFKPQLEQVEAFRRKKSELEKKIEVIEGLDRARRGPVRMMAELADRIPDRVYLKSVEASGGRVKIQGEGMDNETIALFLRALADSDYFVEIDLEGTKLSAARSGLKNVQFDVKASVEGPKPEAPQAPQGKSGARAKRGGAKAPSAAASASRAKG